MTSAMRCGGMRGCVAGAAAAGVDVSSSDVVVVVELSSSVVISGVSGRTACVSGRTACAAGAGGEDTSAETSGATGRALSSSCTLITLPSTDLAAKALGPAVVVPAPLGGSQGHVSVTEARGQSATLSLAKSTVAEASVRTVAGRGAVQSRWRVSVKTNEYWRLLRGA
jgi:hypothetical protein